MVWLQVVEDEPRNVLAASLVLAIIFLDPFTLLGTSVIVCHYDKPHTPRRMRASATLQTMGGAVSLAGGLALVGLSVACESARTHAAWASRLCVALLLMPRARPALDPSPAMRTSSANTPRLLLLAFIMFALGVFRMYASVLTWRSIIEEPARNDAAGVLPAREVAAQAHDSATAPPGAGFPQHPFRLSNRRDDADAGEVAATPRVQVQLASAAECAALGDRLQCVLTDAAERELAAPSSARVGGVSSRTSPTSARAHKPA